MVSFLSKAELGHQSAFREPANHTGAVVLPVAECVFMGAMARGPLLVCPGKKLMWTWLEDTWILGQLRQGLLVQSFDCECGRLGLPQPVAGAPPGIGEGSETSVVAPPSFPRLQENRFGLCVPPSLGAQIPYAGLAHLGPSGL